MEKQIISTAQAPSAIGPYSQAVRIGETVYTSGQIPLDPDSMQVVGGDFKVQAEQVISNLRAIAVASGGCLDDVIKLTVYMTDLTDFSTLNDVMSEHFNAPYPARSAVQVAALPKDVSIEIDAVLLLS